MSELTVGYDTDEGYKRYIIGHNESLIFFASVIPQPDDTGIDAEWYANLFANAPDLLDALRILRVHTAVAAEGTPPLPQQSREDLELIDTVIAKATAIEKAQGGSDSA